MYYYLIGIAKDKISGPTSPTYRDMMQNFLFYHWILKKDKKESAQLVVKNAMILWNNLKIETKEKVKMERTVIKEFDDWHNDIYRHQNAKTEEQKRKRADFKSKLDTVFDAAKEKTKRSVQHNSPDFGVSEPKKKLSVVSDPDGIFTRTRRSLQFGESSSTASETNLFESTLAHTQQSTRFGETSSTASETNLSEFADLELSDIGDDIGDDDYDDNDDDSEKSSDPDYEQYYMREEQKVKFINSHVVSTIDAIGLSDYKAARLLTSVAQALGYDLDDVTVSRTTIQRRRAENRKLIAEAVKKGFKVNL